MGPGLRRGDGTVCSLSWFGLVRRFRVRQANLDVEARIAAVGAVAEKTVIRAAGEKTERSDRQQRLNGGEPDVSPVLAIVAVLQILNRVTAGRGPFGVGERCRVDGRDGRQRENERGGENRRAPRRR